MTQVTEEDTFEVPFLNYAKTLIVYFKLLFLGYLRQYFFLSFDTVQAPKGYAPLLEGFGTLYTRYVYGPISDCWNRPICSTPGARVDIVEQIGEPFVNLKPTGKVLGNCLNLGSYNYLGFAENKGECLKHNLDSLQKYQNTTASFRLGLGTLEVHSKLEKKVASFLGTEDALVFGMGYGTNSTCIPGLIGKGGLILSDSLNHASIVNGSRLSGAHIMVFKHNDCQDLEGVLQKALKSGQPRTHKPWTKILIITEGLYSMEGDVVCLPEIIAIKKKYKAYLYVDEAHSVGALGKSGRGVCDYWDVNPKDVDVLMGTFTKSFASCGGYVAASAQVIKSLRCNTFLNYYETSISSVCATQIISVLDILMGQNGTNEGSQRIENLRRNSIYFRQKLKDLGFIVLGNTDSPVVPVIMYDPPKLAEFSRYCLEKDIAVVVVGYPATDLIKGRARFCLSSSHTIQQLDEALVDLKDIGDKCYLRFLKSKLGC